MKSKYGATIDDKTEGTVPLGRVLSVILRTLDDIASAGPIVLKALTTGYPLARIVLYPTDKITTGCYEGAMADYEIDEATLYIAAGRLLDVDSDELMVGKFNTHNVGLDFRTVLAHELGHVVMPHVEDAIGKKFRIFYDESPQWYWEQTVSKYAGQDDHELFAEAFAAYTHPDYGSEREGDGYYSYKILPACLLPAFIDSSITPRAIEKLQKAGRKKNDITLPDGTVVTAATIDEILDAITEEDWVGVQGTLSESMQEAFSDAGYEEIKTIGVTDQDLFSVVDEGAQQYAKERSAELVSGLDDSTRNMVRGTVEDAVTEGWGQKELTTELANNYGFSENRAATIAHTEIAMAHSHGRVDVAKEAGATKKIWLLSDDHDEDEDCSCSDAADAGAVDMDASFVDGDDDYDFPPAHPNCLCDWAAEYGDEDDSDDEDDDDAAKLAKGDDYDDDPDYENPEVYDADYAEQAPGDEEAAWGQEVADLANAAVMCPASTDHDGQRISGRARSTTESAIAGHEPIIDRINDHRRAYELHALAAKHYEDDVPNPKAAALHAQCAAKHQEIVASLDAMWRLVQKRSVDRGAHTAATSPLNDAVATDKQKKAGNYKMGHLRVGGINISIENPAGTRRRPEWEKLHAHYGYIKLTEGADGDHIDVFVKVGTDDNYHGSVYVIDQYIGGKFDEHKCMVGWSSKQEATKAYLKSYQKGWRLGPVTRMTWKQFINWVKGRTQTKPVAP